MLKLSIVTGLLVTGLLGAGGSFSEWIADADYINGVLYIEGNKGVVEIKKEIASCPYEKCKANEAKTSNILPTTTIVIKQKDYKKAIQYLLLSVKKGNVLAADKLAKFLIRRVDYKSKQPDMYLVKVLQEEIGLTYEQYVDIMHKLLRMANLRNSCFLSFKAREAYQYGYFNMPINEKNAEDMRQMALSICPDNSIEKLMSTK